MLCTTAPEQLLPTIRSRCQRVRFGAGSPLTADDPERATRIARLGDELAQMDDEHDPTLPPDIDAAVNMLSHQLNSVFPNSRLLVKRTVSQRDLVAVHAFWDQKPGETPGVARLDLYRLVNAKIVEHWNVEQAVPEGRGEDSGMF